MTLNEIIKQSHENATARNKYQCPSCSVGCDDCDGTGKTAKDNVFWDMKSELFEFDQSSPSDTFHKDSEQSEIADMIMILLAYSKEAGYDIEKAIVEKLEYNKVRFD